MAQFRRYASGSSSIKCTKKYGTLIPITLKNKAIGNAAMETNSPTKQENSTIKSIVLCAALLFITFVLLTKGIITEPTFLGLVCISMFTSLIIYFENRIDSFGFGKNKAKLKSIEEKTNAIVIKQSEPPIINSMSGVLPALTCEAYGTNEKTQAVIKSIGGTKYTFRNIEGIVADSNLPEEIAKDNLNWLILHKLADVFDIDGEKMYALSQKGRDAFHNTVNPPK